MLGTDIPNPKTIINDYDYCDYWWGFRNSWHDEEGKIKYKDPLFQEIGDKIELHKN